MNLVSELIIAKNGLVSASSSSDGAKSQGFNEEIEYLERVTTNLHESVMKVRMMPQPQPTQTGAPDYADDEDDFPDELDDYTLDIDEDELEDE